MKITSPVRVLVLALSVGLTGISLTHCGPRATAPATAAPPIPTVPAVAVTLAPLVQRETIPGELQPYESVAIYPRVDGFVEWIGVDRGSYVRRGQLLARLSAPELLAQRAAAQSQVQRAESQRLEAEARFNSAQGTWKHLQAAALTPGVVAGNDVDVARQAAQAAGAAVKAGADNVSAARAALRAVADTESYLRLTSPLDGVVIERNVHPGALVSPRPDAGNPPLLRIASAHRLRLVVAVPEREIAIIPLGTPLAFTVPAYPGRTFQGVVARLAHDVDPQTRTMAVELDVRSPQGNAQLTPGMFPQVSWTMRRPDASLFVPSTAVVRTTERTFVVRLRGGHAEWVDVRPGETMGDQMEVFNPPGGSLAEGDLVALRGSDELRAGTAVHPQTRP